MPEARFTSFIRGFTDNWINGEEGYAKKLDNFLLDDLGYPYQRGGYQLYGTTQVPTGATTITDVTKHPSENILIYVSAANRVYHYGGSNFVEIKSVNNASTPFYNTSFFGKMTLAVNNSQHVIMHAEDLTIAGATVTDGFVQMGLPAADEIVITPNNLDGASYVYATVLLLTFDIAGVTYEWYGPPTYKAVSNACDFTLGGRVNAISSYAALTNGTGEHYPVYDGASFQKLIYRTTNGGQILFKVTSLNNSVTTYNDTMTDAVLQNQPTLYITGGIPDNDPPPDPTTGIVITNDRAWYLSGFRLYQSKTLQPNAVPASWYAEFDNTPVGVSYIDIYPIVFLRDRIIRIEGTIDELGGGSLRKRVIVDDLFFYAAKSIVKVRNEIFFITKDGVYITNGYQVRKISSHLNLDINPSAIYGVFHSGENRIYWRINSNITSEEQFLILDLDKDYSRNGAFTTFTPFEPSNYESFDIVALDYNWNTDKLMFGHKYGYVTTFDNDSTEDIIMNSALTPANWGEQAVIVDFESCAMSFGTELFRKWSSKVLVAFRNLSNITLGIYGVNDLDGEEHALKEINRKDHATNTKAVVEKRHFPRNFLRYIYKRIRIRKAKTVVYRSDDYDLADFSIPTVQLNSGTWPTDVRGMWIANEDDGYVQMNPISNVSGDTLTLSSWIGFSNVNDKKWIIRGYPKGEKIYFLGFTLPFITKGDGQKAYDTSESVDA